MHPDHNQPSAEEGGSRATRLLCCSLALNIALLAAAGIWLYLRGGIHGVWRHEAPAEVSRRWDPAAPEHFKNYPHEPHATVFLGDSITAEAPFAEYFANLRNRGVGGDTSAGLLRRLDEALQNTPDRVFIHIGTNDLSKGVEPADLLANFRKIIERAKTASPAARIYVIGILPINLGFADTPNQRAKQLAIVEANTKLAALVPSMGAAFIDVTAKLADGDGQLRRSLTWDGLHLNWPGYQVYCQAIHDFVVQAEREKK